MFEWLCKKSDTPENRFNLALARMNLRDYEAAAELLEPIYQKLPDQLFAGITYAQCLLLMKRFDAAKDIYQTLSKTHPQNNLLKTMLALSQDTLGRDKFASSLDLQMQAALLLEDKQFEAALKLLQTAGGLTPDDAALYNNLGAVKLKLKYPVKEVMADFSKAMQLSPDNDRYKRNYRKVWLKSQN